MSPLDINPHVLICFVVLFDIAAFDAKFSTIMLPAKISLQGLETVAVPAAKDIRERMEVKSSRRSSALKESQFLECDNLALLALRCEHDLQVFRAMLATHMCAMKDGRLEALSP